MVPIQQTTKVSSAPPEMAYISGTSAWQFVVSGIEIEGGNMVGVDVQYPWESEPGRYHNSSIQISSFYMDIYPVTNLQYKQFANSSNYYPKVPDNYNYLLDWQNGTYPQGWDNKPVTWVSLDDARAYCAWANKRLPHEWEWQYVASGRNYYYLYPWGNQFNAANIPVPNNGRNLNPNGPDDVNAHPGGVSRDGIYDLVGNIWQWTDEFYDEHTAASTLKGGSYYHPSGSMWYFPLTYKNVEHGKLLLLAPSIDRAGTLGFRCIVDATS